MVEVRAAAQRPFTPYADFDFAYAFFYRFRVPSPPAIAICRRLARPLLPKMCLPIPSWFSFGQGGVLLRLIFYHRILCIRSLMTPPKKVFAHLEMASVFLWLFFSNNWMAFVVTIMPHSSKSLKEISLGSLFFLFTFLLLQGLSLECIARKLYFWAEASHLGSYRLARTTVQGFTNVC